MLMMRRLLNLCCAIVDLRYVFTCLRDEMISQHLPKTQVWSTQAVRTKPGQEMQPSMTADGQAHLVEIKNYLCTCVKCEALYAGLLRVDNVYSLLYWHIILSNIYSYVIEKSYGPKLDFG